MKQCVCTATLAVVGILLFATNAFAHGDQYVGPGDTVPPGNPRGQPVGPGTNPSTSGGGAEPGTLGSGNPGNPNSPGSASAPTTGGGSGDLGSDLTTWDFWWAFNRDPYLNLKSHVHGLQAVTGSDGFYIGRNQKDQSKDTLRPTNRQIRGTVVPALRHALETETNNDIVTACLIALAKIGEDPDAEGGTGLEELLARFLADPNQEISETAAVSLGILADDSSIDTLSHLLFDTARGRELVDSKEVLYRTRAFAAYGLGLVGARTADEGIRIRVVSQLLDAILSDSTKTRDLGVACVVAMGLVPLETVLPPDDGEREGEGDTPRITCLVEQIEFLLGYLRNDENRHLVRAHVPTALGRLLAGLPVELRDLYKEEVAEALLERLSRKANDEREVVQSAILALGSIGDADDDPVDRRIRETLASVPKQVKDAQARYFSLIAMAQVGSDPGRGDGAEDGIGEAIQHLLGQLVRGKTQAKPWAVLSIGVLGRRLADAEIEHAAVPGMTAALRDSLRTEREGRKLGALAIGVGLLGDVESADILLEKLARTRDDEARGYLAVGLGLMNARRAVAPIQEIAHESRFRPDLLRKAAISLGLLGDKDLVPKLVDMMAEASGVATQSAIARALGFIGDERSIDPLVEMLRNEDLSPGARGFAAVALGIVADKEPLPWNSKIGVGLNYRAATYTLCDQQGAGILNIM